MDVSLRFFSHHLQNLSLKSVIDFPFPSRSGEVSHSAMLFKLLDDTAHSRHRNFKIFGDGLVALTLPMFLHNFVFKVFREFFGLLSFLHAQCGVCVWHRTEVESTSVHFNWLLV